MKEYDEIEAVNLMMAALPESVRDTDSVCEVLDLIYDYYDDNGDLEIDLDDDDDNEDIAEMVDYIARMMAKNPPAMAFTDAEIAAMVKAEIEYENSLL